MAKNSKSVSAKNGRNCFEIPITDDIIFCRKDTWGDQADFFGCS